MSITAVSAIHHFTVGCAPEDLPVLLDFYTRVLGLKAGWRPALQHPGHWLYADDGPAIVHLNALRSSTPARDSGAFDHVALTARGLAATKAALEAAKLPYSESPLKDTGLYQVFVHDPLGVRIELNFDLAMEG